MGHVHNSVGTHPQSTMKEYFKRSRQFYIWSLCAIDEVILIDNCVKGSRPVSSNDSSFDESLHHVQFT